MKVFNDTTALAAATLTAGQMVSVKEVGEYRIKASGSGITLANGNIAVPVASGTAINVLQFGAVGDGVADDTAAIQAAIDHFKSLVDSNGLNGAKLCFGGTGNNYRVTAGLDFTSIRRTSIIDLEGSIITADYNDGDPVIDLVDQRYVTLMNGELRTASGKAPQCGILLARRATDDRVTSYIRLERLFVTGTFKIAAYANISSELSTVVSCRFENTYAGGTGVTGVIMAAQNAYGLSSSHVTITSNTVSNICHSITRTTIYKQNSNQGYGMIINNAQYVNSDRIFIVADGDLADTYAARAAVSINALNNSDVDFYVERQYTGGTFSGQDYTAEVVGNISNLNMQVVGNNLQTHNLLINEVSEVTGCHLAASKGIKVDHTTTATFFYQCTLDAKNGAFLDLSGAKNFSGTIKVDDDSYFTTLGANPHNLYANFEYKTMQMEPNASRVVSIVSNEIAGPKKYSIVNTTADLNTITDSSNVFRDGSIIYMRANAGRTVTVKHNVGNIRCKSAADFVLSVQAPSAFIYDATFNQWLCME